jgi:hypothetical protein
VLQEDPPRPSRISNHDDGYHHARISPSEITGNRSAKTLLDVEASEHLLEVSDRALHLHDQQDLSAGMESEYIDPAPIPVVVEADLGPYLPADGREQADDITLERRVGGVDEAIELLAAPAHLNADRSTQRGNDTVQA